MKKEDITNKRLFFTNYLVPVAELALMPSRPKRFRFEECQAFIKSTNLNIAQFYYSRFTPFSWFAYYHDYVLVDIPAFNVRTLTAMDIEATINLETSRLQTSLQKKDYLSFFALINPKLALEAYLKLYPEIAGEDKYHLFWYIFSRLQLKLSDFSADFIRQIQIYKKEKFKFPVDNEGNVEVYRGHVLASPVSQASSWTRDINTAIYFSRSLQVKGKVFKGRVHLDKILANIKYRNEKEVICFPGDVADIEELNFKSFADLKPGLDKAGITELYNFYSNFINANYFHRPEGIHGISHIRRVLLLSLILSWMEHIVGNDQNLLCLAALYHDIGRCNDNLDPYHGRESYHKGLSLSLWKLEPEDQEILRFIIENHCINDQQAREIAGEYRVENHYRLFLLYKIFKDADGLDRLRINDLDVKQLRTLSAQKLLLVAQDLLEQIN